jgi:hypothetical protein
MSPELNDKLRAWLATEGYPFELRVGRAFRDAGWNVFHAHHYVDPETAKLREIDVHAAIGPYVGDTKGMGMVGIHLVCECKVSQAKPWIVFTSSHGDDELRLAPHLTVGDVSCRALADAIFTNRGKLTNLVMGPRIGHAITKAFSESRSADPAGPFSAILAAISAATALSNQHYGFQLRAPQTGPWFSIYLPMVVLQGQLFEYYLDASGNEVLEECSRVHVLAYPPASDPIPVVVQIVTAEALASFAAAAHEEARFVAKAILPKANEIWEIYREKNTDSE